MTALLLVRIAEDVVGRLWLDENKRFCFHYDPSWLEKWRIPLSLSLPLRQQPYLDDESHAFFANLLPEQKMREIIARNLRVSLHNDFGLLERIGGDCAGAVSLSPESASLQREPGRYRKLTPDELAAIIRELPQRPLLAGEKGLRLSLAGAQKKLPVFFDEEHFSLGYGAFPSNYIIKPSIENLDSDKDGFTNLVEINALNFPGNPNDHPQTTSEIIPETPVNVTEPAVNVTPEQSTTEVPISNTTPEQPATEVPISNTTPEQPTTEVTGNTTEEQKSPGFEAIPVVVGLLAVACLKRRSIRK